MTRNCLLTCLLAVAAGGLPALAGKYNQVLDVGDMAPAWKQLPGVDGKRHSLADLDSKKAVVVAFTCNSCPYAVDYEDRLIALARKYAERDVAVVAINVNLIQADGLPAMKERSEEKGFNFPYLFDASQQIAKDYGAYYTPEFFVLDKQRRIAYMGAMDDNPKGDNIQVRHVERALDAVLQGDEPPVTETVPIGCRVRYKRERR